MLVGDLLHTRQHLVVGNDHIAQQHVERLAGGLLVGAVDGVAQAQRLVLVDVAHVVGADLLDDVGVLVLAALAQRRDQLGIGAEVVLDRLLLAAVDDHDLVGGRGEPLLDDVLDDGAVDDQQHLLGLRLGRREEPRAQARGGNESLHR